MKEEDIERLKKRFKDWAIKYVLFTRKFPESAEFKAARSQMVRCGSSTAANYRAACRAKSGPDFINKMKIVEEELDESLFWLEFVDELKKDLETEISPLFKEGNELLAIVVASIKTARR
jgi:four helix bundle protein